MLHQAYKIYCHISFATLIMGLQIPILEKQFTLQDITLQEVANFNSLFEINCIIKCNV
jgi:hypothetical protein